MGGVDEGAGGVSAMHGAGCVVLASGPIVSAVGVLLPVFLWETLFLAINRHAESRRHGDGAGQDDRSRSEGELND